MEPAYLTLIHNFRNNFRKNAVSALFFAKFDMSFGLSKQLYEL